MFLRSLLPVFIIIFLVACEHTVVNQQPPSEFVVPRDPEPMAMPRPENRAIFTQEQYDSLCRVYITKYTLVAQAMMREYGVPASVLLAQGLHETQAGTSRLARENYNHFGIQCLGEKCSSGHCSNPYSHIHKTFFRIYSHPWQGWEAHAQRLSRDLRYAKYLPQQGIRFNAYTWTRALQDNNFSADRLYGEKIYNLIQKYNLEELDEE